MHFQPQARERASPEVPTSTETKFSKSLASVGRPDPHRPKMHTHWVTSEWAAVPRGSSNLVPFPRSVKYSVFSLVDVINRLDYLEKPNGNKNYSRVRRPSWLN